MARSDTFGRDDLLKCGYGEMFGPGNAQLPVPNMLMMDRITRIADHGGQFGKGEISAKLKLSVTGASKSAMDAVEKAGGSLTLLAPAATPAAE